MQLKTILTFLTFIANTLTVLLFSQNDEWFRKDIDTIGPKEKIEYFTKDLEKVGPTKEAYFFRGKAKLDMKDYQGAVSDFTKVIELDPKYVTAYINGVMLNHLCGIIRAPFRIFP
jgi:tetratricopeptide (TPR) repeat protein